QSENLSELKQNIPISRFPLTFQPAFEVTVQLGFNYIWIDSLCILQDSLADWAAEADRMGHVYENACLNIAA
ncbi:heterokaryon incompatibility, partial [Zopfia rhizophila CBS 207.26]